MVEHCYRCAIGQHDKCSTGLCSHTIAADRWLPCACEPLTECDSSPPSDDTFDGSKTVYFGSSVGCNPGGET